MNLSLISDDEAVIIIYCIGCNNFISKKRAVAPFFVIFPVLICELLSLYYAASEKHGEPRNQVPEEGSGSEEGRN